MRVPFTKMHGLGNDFVMLDARERTLPPVTGPVAAALADRRTGIGCDQLILLQPASADAPGADFRMRIFNSDGSEVQSCGNAARAVALLHGSDAAVETAGGTIRVSPRDAGAEVDMGAPRFDWDDIPLAYAMDTAAMPVGWPYAGGTMHNPAAVNVGNPHVVFFVEDAYAVPLAEVGPDIETDALFPERINVNVASVSSGELTLRVWERGTGLTRACGTGACATAVAAIRRGLVQSPVTVHLPGGALTIAWQQGGTIMMTGPAQTAFTGSFEWEDFA
ncbi:Diaminopimelate epimerase [Alteripontixanthobacter maritimus]|uniref:Diaminopimelate epimerase n=1 Tax=Alteripontixanthobacter maritimus TaxID=2161824 RepID=A0A369QAQ3_9SPHN|nr:diaminopimelate epimerase [Alteripontixanthobacter maritimus]RDC60317.1 Diaminopimelate epimerase [Alteripontixanthobacter maritimus]